MPPMAGRPAVMTGCLLTLSYVVIMQGPKSFGTCFWHGTTSRSVSASHRLQVQLEGLSCRSALENGGFHCAHAICRFQRAVASRVATFQRHGDTGLSTGHMVHAMRLCGRKLP